ncbi:hypothetical protein AB0G00_26445 [Nocardia salmonicida]|uniref:hypothetical protein n=1 Tax=Nocardia salmonicida TaxID=53431 RepID=UPI0033FECA8D
MKGGVVARVPWSTLSGDEVEAVVSNLLYNEYPRSLRIRPSQGDYGIDIVVPRAGRVGEVWDIYQVKKFATNLDSSQKEQIDKSFRRLMIGLVRRQIPVGDWYLVLPLDPTIENDKWLAAMPDRVIADMFAARPKLPKSAEENENPLTDGERQIIEQWRAEPGRIIDWKGLNACEAWVSKHWYVTDYYLNGGAERLRSAVAEVGKILQRDVQLVPSGTQTSVLTPVEIAEHLRRLQSALDGDPHFRYGISLDPRAPEIITNDQGLIAATQMVATDGSCLTFRIYKRFDESLAERPIPIKLKFAVDDARFDQAAYDRWRKYGTGLSAPAAVEMDLPGGLGGNTDTAMISINPSVEDRAREIRIRVVAEDGSEQAPPVRFSMTSSIGPDKTGVFSKGTDASGLMRTQGQFDAESGIGELAFSLSKLSGAEIGDAWPVVALTAAIVYPNTVQIADKYGLFHNLRQVPESLQLIEPRIVVFLRALHTIQSQVSKPIRIPNFDNLTVSEMREVISAATMIEGRVALATWTEFEIPADIAAQLDPDGYYEIELIGKFEIKFDEQIIALGDTTTARMLSVRFESLGEGKLRALPYLNDTSHHWIGDSPVPPEGQVAVRSRKIEDAIEERASASGSEPSTD